VLNVRPTNSMSSRLSDIGSTVSFGRGRKSFVFVLQMVFLDGSVGNNTYVTKVGALARGRKIRVLTGLQTGFHGKQSIEANERLLSLKC